jgi:hypothetical protein
MPATIIIPANMMRRLSISDSAFFCYVMHPNVPLLPVNVHRRLIALI